MNHALREGRNAALSACVGGTVLSKDRMRDVGAEQRNGVIFSYPEPLLTHTQ